MGKLIGGILLILIALFMLIGFAKANVNASGAVLAITFALAVILPGAAGVGLILAYRRGGKQFSAHKEALKQQTLSSEILKFAMRKGGKLMVVEVVSEFAVDEAAAKAALDAFHNKGMAEIELTDAGVMVYSFYDIQHLGEKSSSRGVLDD